MCHGNFIHGAFPAAVNRLARHQPLMLIMRVPGYRATPLSLPFSVSFSARVLGNKGLFRAFTTLPPASFISVTLSRAF